MANQLAIDKALAIKTLAAAGRSERQIAAALGSSESAVKSLLFRAYETLRGRLAHLAGGK